MQRSVSREQIDKFLEKNGQRGREAIEMLARTSEFADAFENPVFQQNFADANAIIQSLLEKIWNETADETDKADFRAYKRIVAIWQKRYQNHKEAVTKINGG